MHCLYAFGSAAALAVAVTANCAVGDRQNVQRERKLSRASHTAVEKRHSEPRVVRPPTKPKHDSPERSKKAKIFKDSSSKKDRKETRKPRREESDRSKSDSDRRERRRGSSRAVASAFKEDRNSKKSSKSRKSTKSAKSYHRSPEKSYKEARTQGSREYDDDYRSRKSGKSAKSGKNTPGSTKSGKKSKISPAAQKKLEKQESKKEARDQLQSAALKIKQDEVLSKEKSKKGEIELKDKAHVMEIERKENEKLMKLERKRMEAKLKEERLVKEMELKQEEKMMKRRRRERRRKAAKPPKLPRPRKVMIKTESTAKTSRESLDSEAKFNALTTQTANTHSPATFTPTTTGAPSNTHTQSPATFTPITTKDPSNKKSDFFSKKLILNGSTKTDPRRDRESSLKSSVMTKKSDLKTAAEDDTQKRSTKTNPKRDRDSSLMTPSVKTSRSDYKPPEKSTKTSIAGTKSSKEDAQKKIERK
ncbi:unnamed protein product [Caenorhabditis auriculariae]|uniref:Uncharacterized protein n=1 Tax=Caenorhabditis auriculariae TaxID=2777116 RepID=A0A8S1HXI7_9PELO|nr:unnamed protein product [Caenorhabditis auriculariae]